MNPRIFDVICGRDRLLLPSDVSERESARVADSAFRLKKMMEKVMRLEEQEEKKRDNERSDTSRMFWAGVIFAAVTLFFLMGVTMRSSLNPRQMRIIRFIAALCGGASGAFMGGVAVMKAEIEKPGLKLAICGTAGLAVFFVVLLLFNFF